MLLHEPHIACSGQVSRWQTISDVPDVLSKGFVCLTSLLAHRHAVLCDNVRGFKRRRRPQVAYLCIVEFFMGSRKSVCCPGRAKWWQQALGLVPKTNLVRELGKEHNVTMEAFAQTACLVCMRGALSGVHWMSLNALSVPHFQSGMVIRNMHVCTLTRVVLQVGAYAFACQRGSWPFHYRAVCLLPLMDMLNHRRDGESNAVVDQNKNGSYSCYAKRNIKAGEEVGLSAMHEASSHAHFRSLLTVAAKPQQKHNQGCRLHCYDESSPWLYETQASVKGSGPAADVAPSPDSLFQGPSMQSLASFCPEGEGLTQTLRQGIQIFQCRHVITGDTDLLASDSKGRPLLAAVRLCGRIPGASPSRCGLSDRL